MGFLLCYLVRPHVICLITNSHGLHRSLYSLDTCFALFHSSWLCRAVHCFFFLPLIDTLITSSDFVEANGQNRGIFAGCLGYVRQWQ